jgi:hypothetical protein
LGATTGPRLSETTSKFSEAVARDLHYREHALQFLMRGIVHGMNNVLAVFSSQLQVFESQPPGRHGLSRLKEQATHGSHGLELVALVLGEPSLPYAAIPLEPVCLGTLLRRLDEFLLLERNGFRYSVELSCEPQVCVALDPSAFLVALVLLLERVTHELPTEVPGTVTLQVASEDRGARVTIGFRIAEGHLPFPVHVAPIATDLLEWLRDHGFSISGTESGRGGGVVYELVVQQRGVSHRASETRAERKEA